MPLFLFAGEEYYPHGGWRDFIGTANNIDEARENIKAASTGNTDWYQIVNADTLITVESGSVEDATTYDPYEEKRNLIPDDQVAI